MLDVGVQRALVRRERGVDRHVAVDRRDALEPLGGVGARGRARCRSKVSAPACAQTTSKPVGSGIRHAANARVALERGERRRGRRPPPRRPRRSTTSPCGAGRRAPRARAAPRRRRPSCRRCRARGRSRPRSRPTTARRAPTAREPGGDDVDVAVDRQPRPGRARAGHRDGERRAARRAAPPRPGGRGARAAPRGRARCSSASRPSAPASSPRRSSAARSSPVTLGTRTSAATSRASASASRRPSAASSVVGGSGRGELGRPRGHGRLLGGDPRLADAVRRSRARTRMPAASRMSVATPWPPADWPCVLDAPRRPRRARPAPPVTASTRNSRRRASSPVAALIARKIASTGPSPVNEPSTLLALGRAHRDGRVRRAARWRPRRRTTRSV